MTSLQKITLHPVYQKYLDAKRDLSRLGDEAWKRHDFQEHGRLWKASDNAFADWQALGIEVTETLHTGFEHLIKTDDPRIEGVRNRSIDPVENTVYWHGYTCGTGNHGIGAVIQDLSPELKELWMAAYSLGNCQYHRTRRDYPSWNYGDDSTVPITSRSPK